MLIISEAKRVAIASGTRALSGPTKVVLKPFIFFPDLGNGRAVDFIWTPAMDQCSKALLIFVTSMSWATVDGREQQGITWIELLILFEIGFWDILGFRGVLF